MDDSEIQKFYQNYRETLSKQNQAALNNLIQQRKNAQASIMSGLNKGGMMYSNFGQREKLKYDMNTYTPAVTNAQQSYQSGLDTLRANILKYQNSIKDIQDAIATLNAT